MVATKHPWLATGRQSLTVDPAVVDVGSTDARVVLGPVSKSNRNPLMSEDELWEAAWWNTNPSLFFRDGTFHLCNPPPPRFGASTVLPEPRTPALLQSTV